MIDTGIETINAMWHDECDETSDVERGLMAVVEGVWRGAFLEQDLDAFGVSFIG